MNQLSSKKTLLLSILALSLPAIIEMALNTMLGVADTIMLGQLIDSTAIASVGFSNQIMYFIIFTFSSFNTGAIAMISRAYGERNFKRLKHIAEQNVVLNGIIGIIIVLFASIFREQIFIIFDIEEFVRDNAIIYFSIILVGVVPMFLSFSFAAILRGSGDTRTPMVITGIVNVINIIGNYVLITGFGPFPELGIAGAAISTTVARLIATMIYIYRLYIIPTKMQLRVKLFIDKKIIKPLFRISWPGAIEQGLMQLSFVVLGIIIAKLSTSEESLFRILIQIESLSFMPAVGISIATATLVGKALGEKDIDKAAETGFASAGLGVVWGIFIGIIFMIFPEALLKAFTLEEKILLLGLPIMPFLAINQPALNFMIIMGGALRGAGDTRTLMVYTISRLWIIFVPFSYFFILVLGAGVKGLWYAEILSFVIFSYIVFLRFKRRKWTSIQFEAHE